MKTIKVFAAVALLLVVSAVSFKCGASDTAEALEELKQYSSYQDSLIEEISTHFWEYHDCECGWYDDREYLRRSEYMHTKYNY